MLAALFAFALLIPRPPARADERRDEDKQVRPARRFSVEDLQNFLDKNTKFPPIAVEPGQEQKTTETVMAKLRKSSTEFMAPMERLDTMRGGYSNAADIAAVDGERNALRRVLLEEQSRFNEQLQLFNSLKKMRQTEDLKDLFAGKIKGDSSRRINITLELEYFGEEMRNIRRKLRSILEEDEQAYEQRRKALKDQRARAEALRRAVMGGGAVILMTLGGAGLWARRRRRPTPAGAVGAGAIIGGNYRLDREVGRGGMGLVFEATDLALQRKVAIKQLRAEIRQNPKDLEMFLAEARLVAALKHPHIVEIYAIVNEGLDLHLVFELVAGQALDTTLRRVGRLALNSAYSLMQQVGSALDFAHANKVIHRDLKPANIMITPQGSAKVMDFGLAHQVSMTVAKLTRAESWGTPPYMAPEQELGEVSRESDLYSLGVMLYEAATGKAPFPGPNYLAQKREMRFALPSLVAPELPKRLDEILLRALQADPTLRFHSAAEFTQALGSLDARG